MSMPAISLWQPWASLCVTREPCFPDERHGHGPFCNAQMVKRFETRSWPCPPNLIGQRIAIHATQREPVEGKRVGSYVVDRDSGGCFLAELTDHFEYAQPGFYLPLGAIVGSATIEACLPIVRPVFGTRPCIWIDQPLSDAPPRLLLWTEGQEYGDNISDQLPFGDWTPGRYAWLLTDAAPTNERCPWCDGGGETVDDIEMYGRTETRHYRCPVCDGAGRCDPIPARGHQRVWNWTP